MLKTRVIVAAALIVVFAAMMYFGGYVQCVILTLAAILSVHEMLSAVKAGGRQPWGWGIYAFAVSYYVVYMKYGITGMVALFSVCITVTMIESIFNKERTLLDVASSLLVFIYPMFFYAILMSTVGLKDYAISRTALFIMFAGPLVGDTMAYFIGCTLGKHKLCPHISPKKTVEGSVGGFLGGILGGLLTYYLQRLWGTDIGIVPLCVMGFICGGMGQIGDLFASFIKRWAGIKDFGKILPGHGGVLDRLDSVLLCGPVVLIYFYVIYV